MLVVNIFTVKRFPNSRLFKLMLNAHTALSWNAPFHISTIYSSTLSRPLIIHYTIHVVGYSSDFDIETAKVSQFLHQHNQSEMLGSNTSLVEHQMCHFK